MVPREYRCLNVLWVIIMPETKLVSNMTRVRALRLLVQFIMFIILNGAIIGLSYSFLILPINQPHTPLSTADGAIYLLQRMLSSAVFPFIPLATFFIIGAVVGRFFCSWACPFGFVQDIVTYLSPFTKYRLNQKTNRQFIDIGLIILIIGVMITSFIGLSGLFDPGNIDQLKQGLDVFADEPLAVFDPATMLFVSVPYIFWWNSWPADFLSVDILFYLRLVILIVALLFPLFIPRAYCRWICPSGALTGRIGTCSVFGIKRNLIRCNHCGECEDACPMGVPILTHPEKIRDPLCTLCLDCIAVCDEGALKIGKGE